MSAVPARPAQPLLATAYMLAACGLFAFNSVFVRLAAADVHPFEIAFFRNFFAIGFILLIALPQEGARLFRFHRLDLLTLRGVINSASMLAWFYAVPLLPLTDLTALGFTAPLWATVLAALVLRETVRIRRWSATVTGFLGALIIIQPGFKEVHWAVYLVLFSSACWGATVILVRHMTGHERPNTILFYQAVMMSLIALVPSLFVWEWPTPRALGWMLILGALSAGAHWCHVRAYSLQEVTALQPLDFARLPIIAVAAWLIFGEVPDAWLWVGAAVVFGAGTYISHREAQLRRRAVASGR